MYCDDVRTSVIFAYAVCGGWITDPIGNGLFRVTVDTPTKHAYWTIGAWLKMLYFYDPKKERSHNRLRSFLISLF